jgi:hypothetical protein
MPLEPESTHVDIILVDMRTRRILQLLEAKSVKYRLPPFRTKLDGVMSTAVANPVAL